MRLPVWSARARADIVAQVDWVEQVDPVAARRLRDAIDRRAIWLADLPYAGAKLGATEARSFHVLGTSYIIVYRPIGEAIEILRVRHAAENWRA